MTKRSSFHSSSLIYLSYNWLIGGRLHTHILKNSGLGMLNLWSTYYIEICYLEVSFCYVKVKSLRQLSQIFSSLSSYILFCFVNKFLGNVFVSLLEDNQNVKF